MNIVKKHRKSSKMRKIAKFISILIILSLLMGNIFIVTVSAADTARILQITSAAQILVLRALT